MGLWCDEISDDTGTRERKPRANRRIAAIP
jgi:hypothetical protein